MRSLLPASLVLLAACGDPNTFTLKSEGATVDVTVEPFAFVVRAPDGHVVLTSKSGADATGYGAFTATVDRPTYEDQIVPGWDGYRAKEDPWALTGKATLVSKTDTTAEVSWPIDGATVHVTLSVDGARVRVEASTELAAQGPKYNKATLAFALPQDEHFFGLGERFATFDHRGQSLYSWCEEGALGQGEDAGVGPANPYPNGPSMTYFPVPFFLSSEGYGLHVDTTYRSELHLGSERADAWRVAVNTTALALTVYVHDAPTKSLDDFTQDTGRPIIPAPWVWGPRRRLGPGSTVDGGAEYQVMRDRKLPLTGIDDAVHFLPAASQVGRETELADWTSRMHALGYKVMAYNNPYVAVDAPNVAADYGFGADAGYFVKNADGTPATDFLISGSPLTITMVDFTNPAAATWYRGLLKRTLDLGYDGWMHDFGEYVPRAGRLFDGRKGDAVHNPYPMLSAKEARAVLQEAKPDDHLFFVRAGYTGSQAYVPAVWGGDAETSFDETQGIPSTIRSGLNLALSGVPYWGSDGTGFKCLGDAPRDKEVYVRWLELEAVSPIMMDQNACSNPLEKRTKWTLWSDDETQDVYRRMAGFHTRLQPYFRVLAKEANASGLPLMRPPFLFFPKEPKTWSLDDAFFFGPALYAAPVLRRGVTTREVWLPPGARYVDWDDATVHAGGETVSVSAPLAKLPLFLVEGQLVPMLDAAVQTLAPATDATVVTAASKAGVLDVRVALGPNGRASLTLVDGTVLSATWTSDGGRTGLTEAASVDDCSSCFHVESHGSVDEVHVAGASSASSTVRFDALTLSSSGGPVRRVRWHVVRLK